MPSRAPAIDPLLLKEQRQKISCSISLPIGWLTALRRHASEEQESFSEIVMRALEEYGKKHKLDFVEVKR